MNLKISEIGKQVRVSKPKETFSVNKSLKKASAKIEELEVKKNNDYIPYENNIENTAKAVEEIQKLCDQFNRKLQFSVSKDTNRVIVKVIDSNTEKVIRVIPSEETQRLQARLKEVAGFLFDERI